MMTPEQARFLAMIEESRELAPEILSAVEKLEDDDLELWQLENLIHALLEAPEKDDAEFYIGGIVRG